jgi:uracil-DNA glycosylase family 4
MIYSYQTFSKAVRFKDLVESVQHCNLCSRLCDRTKVLSIANGNIDSKVLFVAEAPGRLGADRTGIPLHGDKTGDNFENLLGNIGWNRGQIFITNAILCNPREDNGTNGTPTREEIANCSSYLEMIINLIRPEAIVSLGATALEALDLIAPHGLQLQKDVATLISWSGTKLFPLYHPGPRATVHRSLSKQRSDFILLSKILNPIQGIKPPKTKKLEANDIQLPIKVSPMQQVAQVLLELAGRMTYFKMTKLMYLIDLFSIERFGHTVASSIYLRQTEGPWPPELNKELDIMQGYEIRRFFIRSIPMVALGPSPRFKIQLNNEIIEIISDAYRKYGSLSNAEIKTAVYRTDPMQFILGEEKKGMNMVNKPVIYNNKTARELSIGSINIIKL